MTKTIQKKLFIDGRKLKIERSPAPQPPQEEDKRIKVLITGSAGFIGSHLMKALQLQKDKYKILGVDRKFGVDITEFAYFGKATAGILGAPDIIVHLAATCSTSQSFETPQFDFINNCVGTFNVVEMARLFESKVIYTSTCKVEPTESGQKTPYGLTKGMGEDFLREWGLSYGLNYVINRPGTVYGPGQKGSPESGWLAWFLKARKEKTRITIYGDGKQTRDILWVNDYVSLLMDQIANFDKYKGQTYKVGGGLENEISLLQALEFMNYKNYSFAPERKGDIKRFVSENKEVSAVNGWKPKMKWQDGIKLTISALKKNGKL